MTRKKMVEMIVGRVWERPIQNKKMKFCLNSKNISQNYIRRFKNIDKLKFTNLESRKI